MDIAVVSTKKNKESKIKAHISFDGKVAELGYFNTFNEVDIAYREVLSKINYNVK